MANEKRLIDANALDNKLETLKVRFKAQGRDAVAEDYNFVQTVLLTAPTVDAVEVVRCKDCIHSRQREWYTEKLYCAHQSHMYSQVPFRLPPEHFCSYGERKDNG